MSKATEATTIEQFEQKFYDKINNLKKLVVLKAGLAESSDVNSVLLAADKQLDSIEDNLAILKFEIAKQRQELAQAEALKKEMLAQNARLEYIENNIPSRLPALLHHASTTHTTQSNSAILKPKVENESTIAKVQKEKVEKPRNKIRQIEYLTIEEFKSVPSYMKMRFSYDYINKVIDGMNTTLSTKYKIVYQSKKSMSEKTKQKFREFRDQETKDTTGFHFFVFEDLRSFSKLKIDRNLQNVMPILRHCTRLKEVRGNGLVRYTVV